MNEDDPIFGDEENQEQVPDFTDSPQSDAPKPEDIPAPETSDDTGPVEGAEPPPKADGPDTKDLDADIRDLGKEADEMWGRIASLEQQLQEKSDSFDELQEQINQLRQSFEDRRDDDPAGFDFVNPLPDVFPAKNGTAAGTWISQEIKDGAFVDGALAETVGGDFAPIELDTDMFFLARKMQTVSGTPQAGYIKISGGGGSNCIPVLLENDGGAPGSTTTQSTLTYTVKSLDAMTTYATEVENSYTRPEVGLLTEATYGIWFPDEEVLFAAEPAAMTCGTPCAEEE